MLINEIKPGMFLADDIRLYRIIDFKFPSTVKVPGKWYPLSIHGSTLSWLQLEGSFSVDKLARVACLSHRQLDRKFKEWIGLSPKLFLQMARFDKTFRMKNRYPGKDWLAIAMHLEYHDYQHLV
jgi:AraC-like DNA-binding protein